MPGRGSRVRPLPWGGAGTPGGHPESGPCPREEQAPRGGAGTPGGSPESMYRGGAGIPGWGSRVRPLPCGGGLTLGASAHVGPRRNRRPSRWAACRIISPWSGCPRKGWGGQEPIQCECGPWCRPWQAGCRLSTSCPPTKQQEGMTLSGQTGQWVKLTCPSVRF